MTERQREEAKELRKQVREIFSRRQALDAEYNKKLSDRELEWRNELQELEEEYRRRRDEICGRHDKDRASLASDYSIDLIKFSEEMISTMFED